MLDRLIVFGFLAVLSGSALAMGTVEPWSVALFEIATLTLAFLWLCKALHDRRLEISLPPFALPIAGLLLLGICQGIAIQLGDGSQLSLSKDVEATRIAVLMIFFLFLLSLLASNFFATRERLRMLAFFLTAYGLGLAVFAIIQHFTWDGRLFWIREIKNASGLGGPFVNRNHFAGYMDMLAPVSAALALVKGERHEVRILCGFAATIMGVSVAASLSRGGLVSLAAGLLFVAAASMPSRSSHRSRLARTSVLKPLAAIMLIAISIVGGVFWVGADLGLADRIASGEAQRPTSRFGIWRDSLSLIKANPLTGVGLGAFDTTFPIYSQGDGSQRVEFVHNDYLQALTDGGVIGGLLALWFLMTIGRSIAKGVRSSDRTLRTLAVGGSGGVVALLIHSFFDFNLQIPSNALMFLLLCAIVSRAALVPGKAPVAVERFEGVESREFARSAL